MLALRGEKKPGMSYINAGIPTVFFSSSPKICGKDEAQLVAPVLPLAAVNGRSSATAHLGYLHIISNATS